MFTMKVSQINITRFIENISGSVCSLDRLKQNHNIWL